jgi:hypothetical protein
LQIVGYGLTITSLEEVFLKVGGDEDLVGEMASGQGVAGGEGGSSASSSTTTSSSKQQGGRDKELKYTPLLVKANSSHYLLITQILALWKKRVT